MANPLFALKSKRPRCGARKPGPPTLRFSSGCGHLADGSRKPGIYASRRMLVPNQKGPSRVRWGPGKVCFRRPNRKEALPLNVTQRKWFQFCNQSAGVGLRESACKSPMTLIVLQITLNAIATPKTINMFALAMVSARQRSPMTVSDGNLSRLPDMRFPHAFWLALRRSRGRRRFVPAATTFYCRL